MDKAKYRPDPRNKRERIGSITGLMDKNKNYLLVGDEVQVGPYKGALLWNRHYNCYGLCFGLWYGEKNEYDFDCYGKFIEVPSDNGMRMEIEKEA